MLKLIVGIISIVIFSSCGIKMQLDPNYESIYSGEILVNIEFKNQSWSKKKIKEFANGNTLILIKENNENTMWEKATITPPVILLSCDQSEFTIKAKKKGKSAYLIKSNLLSNHGEYTIKIIHFNKRKEKYFNSTFSNRKVKNISRKGIEGNSLINIKKNSKADEKSTKWIKNNNLEMVFKRPKKYKFHDKEIFESFIDQFPESEFINTAKFLYAKNVYFNFKNETSQSKETAGLYLLELKKNNLFNIFFTYEIQSYRILYHNLE